MDKKAEEILRTGRSRTDIDRARESEKRRQANCGSKESRPSHEEARSDSEVAPRDRESTK